MHRPDCDRSNSYFSGEGYNRVKVCICGAEDHAPQNWKRIGRLVRLIPAHAKRLGCRRRDHANRAAVDNVHPDTKDRDAILERRRKMSRRDGS